MYNGQVEKYVAAIFAFGAPSTINAGLTRYLAALGAAVTTTELAVIIPRDGRLKNLYWSSESSGLSGSNHKISVMVNGAATTLETTWNGNLTSGNNVTGSVVVTKGQRLAVRVQLASGGTTITRLRVSLELEVDSEYPNPWDFDGTDISFGTGGKVGIGTNTPSEMLTVDGVVEASGGFKFPDGSVQMEAANPATGAPHSLDAADGNPIDAVFVADGGNVGVGYDPALQVPQEKLVLVSGSNLAVELPIPGNISVQMLSETSGNLSPGTYNFWVTATDGVGWTKACDPITVNLPSTANCIVVTWDTIPGATAYRLYRTLDSNPVEYKFVEISTNTYNYVVDGPFGPDAPPYLPPPSQTTAYINKLSSAGDTWLKGGKIGIGTAKPQTVLHVSGMPIPFQGTTPGTLRIDSIVNATGTGNFQAIDFGYEVGSNPTARIGAYHDGAGSKLWFGTSGLYASGITNTAMVINPAGHVIVDTLIQNSSRILKTNIQPIEDALAKVMKLYGVTFDWKKNGKHDIGLIAEDVEQVTPEVVLREEGSENAQGVNYSRLVAVLIEAVKEQQGQIEELKGKVSSILANKVDAAASA